MYQHGVDVERKEERDSMGRACRLGVVNGVASQLPGDVAQGDSVCQLTARVYDRGVFQAQVVR